MSAHASNRLLRSFQPIQPASEHLQTGKRHALSRTAIQARSANDSVAGTFARNSQQDVAQVGTQRHGLDHLPIHFG